MAKAAGWLAVMAMFVLVAGVFGACGDDGDPDAAPTTAAVSPQPSTPGATPEATAAAEPTLAPDVSALLVGLPTAAELGPGWEEEARGPTLPTDTTLCGEPVDFATSEVIAAFTKSASQHLSAIVGIARNEDGVIEQLRAGLEGCGELTSTGAGRTTVYQVQPAEFDAFGDDTLAIKATSQVDPALGTSESYFVIIEDGDLVLAVVDSFIGTADPAEAETVVIAAYEALQRIE